MSYGKFYFQNNFKASDVKNIQEDLEVFTSEAFKLFWK